MKTEYSEDEMPLHAAFAEVLLTWQAKCPASQEGWVFPNPNTGGVWHASVLQGGSPCSGRQGTRNRATWLAHFSAQLPFDAGCLWSANRP